MLSIFKRGRNACKNRCMAAHTMHSNDTQFRVNRNLTEGNTKSSPYKMNGKIS